MGAKLIVACIPIHRRVGVETCHEALCKDRVNRLKLIGKEVETPYIVAVGTIDIAVLAQEYVTYSVAGDFITITGTRLEDNEVVAVETVQAIVGAHPDGALAVLAETRDKATGKKVG